MNNNKNHPPVSKKHQKQVNCSTDVKTTHKNGKLAGIMLKSFKPKLNPDSVRKSPEKNTDVKTGSQQSNSVSSKMLPAVKNSNKRKDEKTNHSIKKKIKIGPPVHNLEQVNEGISLKKPNKIKTAFPKTYICKYCCRRYHSVEELKKHSADHGSKPSHICHLCSHQAASFSALMTHYVKHSGNKTDNMEKIYAKSKADFSNMQMNFLSRPKSLFECNECKLTFSSKSKYEVHNCSEHPKKSEYDCNYCGHISTTVEDYRNHLQTHVEKPFKCFYCKFKVKSKEELLSHHEICKTSIKLKKEYKCDKCNSFKGNSKKAWDCHLKVCNENISNYACSKCHLEFQEKKGYEDHLLVCKNNVKQKPRVKKTYKPRKKLKLSAIEKNKLLCCVCDCVCYSKVEHEEHERQCLAAMANKPDDTANLFLPSSNAAEKSEIGKVKRGDIKTGSLDKSLNADVTRRSSRVRRKSSCIDDEDIVKPPKRLKIKIPKKPKVLFKSQCRKGRQSKNPNNPFQCNYCDFTFCSKSTLLRHKRMHSGNPWYICQYCGKFFFRKDVYIRHEMNVHKKGVKSVFCCYYCKLCFNQSSSLRDHVVAEHKKSAFLPIKPDFSDKRISEKPIKVGIKVKQEPDLKNSEVTECHLDETKEKGTPIKRRNCKESMSSPDLSAFKCSVCFKSFKNSIQIAAHMHKHNKLKTESVEISKSLSVSNGNESTLSSKPASKVSESDSQNLEQSASVSSALSEKCAEDQSDETSVVDVSQNKLSDMYELDLVDDFSAGTSQLLDCKLCSKKFSNNKLLDAHIKTLHKLVDWYQCLVCTACGPKQEILQHMLTHIYKVGSFVVGDTKDYDDIIALTYQANGEQKKSEERSNICSRSGNTSMADDVDLISDDEDLPPLREYGPTPCVDESAEEKECESSYEQYEEHNDVCAEKDTEKIVNSANVNHDEISDHLDGNSSTYADSNNKQTSPPNESVSLSMENLPTKSKSESEKKETSKVIENNSHEILNLAKEDFISEAKSNESIKEDCSQAGSFSQLRYLLQSPSKQNSPEKISLYPFSQLENSSLTFGQHNLPVKPTNQGGHSSDTTNLVTKNEMNFESSKQDINSNESSSRASSVQDNNQSNNTCLKFDINQSRGEFSENLTYHKVIPSSSHKTQNCSEADKNENLFKACPSENPILDFSDLIQNSFGYSNLSDDNLFSFVGPKQVDSQNNIGFQQEVNTPDSTSMVNYDSTGYNNAVKCEHCNMLLIHYNEQMNHRCFSGIFEQSSNIDLYQHKSKNTFQASIANQNTTASNNTITDKIKTPPVEKQTASFVCSMCAKVATSEAELLKHQRAEHAQILQSSSPNNVCTKCHRTFSEIGELMKHSLTCLKTYFLKTSVVNYDSVSSEPVQSFQMKDESKASFSRLSLNSPLPFDLSLPTDLSRQTSENAFKNSFNS